MMGIGEAFAIARPPDLDQHLLPVLRLEGDAAHRGRPPGAARGERRRADGWLSDGHGLDLTMLATAANFETRTNGATHMGNDDCTIFDGMAHLKIIDVSCPQQMLSLMSWTMEGNRGLLYVRVMRTPSAVLYGPRLRVRVRQGHTLRESAADRAVIVSSGRGVHEALAAAAQCAERGAGGRRRRHAVDRRGSADRRSTSRASCWSSPSRTTATSSRTCSRCSTAAASAALAARRTDHGDQHARCATGGRSFIHSGTYEELTAAFGLSPPLIAESIRARLEADCHERTRDSRRRRRGPGPAGAGAAVAGGAPTAVAAEQCSACVIRVAPGDKVRPAHSHPNGEEVIYIIAGAGRVMVGGEVQAVQGGNDGVVSARRRAHAAQHRRRRDEGGLLLRPGDQSRELQDARRRRLPGLKATKDRQEAAARTSASGAR